jgi:hypothetical protein
MRWAEHVRRLRRRLMSTGVWWESQNEGDHYEVLDVHVTLTLRGALEKWDWMIRTRFILIKLETTDKILLKEQHIIGFHKILGNS